MKLQIVTNGTYEEEKALIDISNEDIVVIYKGDQYHDKVDEFINGYIYCLEFNKIKHEQVDDIVLLPEERRTYFDEVVIDKELFELCDFYDEDDESENEED